VTASSKQSARRCMSVSACVGRPRAGTASRQSGGDDERALCKLVEGVLPPQWEWTRKIFVNDRVARGSWLMAIFIGLRYNMYSSTQPGTQLS
jgi:hypothetical protein